MNEERKDSMEEDMNISNLRKIIKHEPIFKKEAEDSLSYDNGVKNETGIHVVDANVWNDEQDFVKKERHVLQTFKTEPKIEDLYDDIEPVTNTSDTNVWNDEQDIKKEQHFSQTFKTEPKMEDVYDDFGPILLKQETADTTTVSEVHSEYESAGKLFPLDVSSQATRPMLCLNIKLLISM